MWRLDRWISDKYGISREFVRETARKFCTNQDWISFCNDAISLALDMQEKAEMYHPILVDKIVGKIKKTKETFSSKKLKTESLHKFKGQRHLSKYFDSTALDKIKIKVLTKNN